jgi:glycosyltransferase involved in cell wall biosynthesis
MRIAQIAPLWESVPPRAYGAVETLVAGLTKALADRGHQVTVFASGDSEVAGELRPVCPRSLNSANEVVEPEIYRMLQGAEIRECAADFDIIHSHLHSNSGCSNVQVLAGLGTPVLHTIHCYFNRDNARLFRTFCRERYVAISNHQRNSLPELNYLATVHHGVDVSEFPAPRPEVDSPYLAFLGRIRPEKGVHIAIDIARRSGLPLRIAGRVKPVDRAYYEQLVRPHIDGERISFLGELGFADKTRLLGQAAAALVTSVIPEPFGLVTVEAMACGTPVLALATGATPELVLDGVTGFVADDPVALAAAVSKVPLLGRLACRQHVEQNFSMARMATDYEAAFASAIKSR